MLSDEYYIRNASHDVSSPGARRVTVRVCNEYDDLVILVFFDPCSYLRLKSLEEVP